MWCFWQAPVELQVRPLDFWLCCPLPPAILHSQKQLQACYWALIKTECLVMRHTELLQDPSVHHDLGVISPTHHKVGLVQLQSIRNRSNTFDAGPKQVQQAQVNCISRWFKFPCYLFLLLHCLSVNLYILEERRKKCRPGLWKDFVPRILHTFNYHEHLRQILIMLRGRKGLDLA